MKMIKNGRLIQTLTPEQKIQLITGVEFYRSRTLDGYGFPILSLSENPMADLGARVTDFPSDRALAATWDPKLTEHVYRCIGNEAKAVAPYACYHIANRTDPNVSSDGFITGRFLSAKANGLSKSGAFVGVEIMTADGDAAEKTIGKRVADAILDAVEPDVLVADDVEILHDRMGLKCGIADSVAEAARLLNEDCAYIYLTHDFTDELIPYLLSLTVEYEKAFAACAHGALTPERLQARCKASEILSMERIDAACDRVIDALLSLRSRNAASVLERKVSIEEDGDALFDEPAHDSMALTAARQSAVLLKNDGILPLKSSASVAVLGAHEAYRPTANTPTAVALPQDVIDDCEWKTVGFADGYRRGASGGELLEAARKLCKQADAALVYLCVDPGEETLPAEQLQLLDALYANGVKIIAAVASDGVFDASFADRCNAVLSTDRGGQQVARAVIEIVTGQVNPSGKLVAPIPEYRNGQPERVQYPLGYGLSYTTFAYSHLQLTDRGATFTVTNTGACDGYVTPQLYIQRQAPQAKGILSGFTKLFLKKNDSAKVEIRFGPDTFRSFDEAKQVFRIANGEYNVYVGDSAGNLKLSGTLTLAEHKFDEEKPESKCREYEDGEQAFREFTDTIEKRAFYNRGRSTAFGIKTTLAILLVLYVDILAAILVFAHVIPSGPIWYIGTGAVVGLVTVGAAVFIAVQAAKRSRLSKQPPAPLLGEVVEQIGEFRELARVSYRSPVAAEQDEDLPQDAPTETVAAESPKVDTHAYDTAFTESGKEEIAFKDNVTFHELCANFHDYALYRGVEVEASSVRALFAALAAAKLILVDVKNKEVLPAFVAALDGYFQTETVDAAESWNANDLMWTLDGGKYVASGFVNAVYSAAHTPDKNAIAVVNHVRPQSVRNWFGPILKYALFPSEEHVWTLNESTSVVLPHNIRYVLIVENDEEIPPELAAASVQIDLLCSVPKAPGSAVEVKPVSFGTFCELVTAARETHFLPETVWKKLDTFVETIGTSERFAIGNKSILQLERFTSVLLECGADESEALIAMLTGKVVARLKTLNLYKHDGGDKKVFDMLQKLFAEENLTRVRKALAKTG